MTEAIYAQSVRPGQDDSLRIRVVSSTIRRMKMDLGGGWVGRFEAARVNGLGGEMFV